VAEATSQGYRVGGERRPFHGYYFKILTTQGPTAPGFGREPTVVTGLGSRPAGSLLSQSDTWTPAILCDELDAGLF
jgi:hypothetical protein